MGQNQVVVDGGVLSYKFQFVSERLVLIKVGQGGSLAGFNNKYDILFDYYIKKGYSVLVCDNNLGISDENSFINTLELAKLLMQQQRTKFYIYYLGFSKGASQFLTFAYRYQNIVKAVLINPPLNINLHKQCDGMKAMKATKIKVYIGELDPSYKFARLLDLYKNYKSETIIYKNADHYFTGMLDEFISVCKGLA